MITFRKAAVLGATGPTGIHLTTGLRGRVPAIRVVSRSSRNLERAFPESDLERTAADVLKEGEALRAIEGCDLVFDCIGLPSELMDRHPGVAANVAAAVTRTGARLVQISSYWAYLPIVRLPLDESHPREGGPPWVRYRREAEDVLQRSGAAVVNLPDFYGPNVHTSVLENALRNAVDGKPMNWIGAADVPREHVFVPDAMRIAVDLAHREEAYGERFLFSGGGPLTGRRAAELAAEHLGRDVKLRAASPWLLRLVGIFDKELRGFLPMVPHYVEPLSFDAGKLRTLLGTFETTPYERGIGETLAWLGSAPRGDVSALPLPIE
jgi:nucleoside-diphosphate-sugar epimerase